MMNTNTPTAPALRAIADQLFAAKRPPLIPADMFALPEATRARLGTFVYEMAAEVEAEGEEGKIEFEMVSPEQSPYTVDESRDLLYLIRSAPFVC